MPDSPFNLLVQILKALAENQKSLTLEELTKIIRTNKNLNKIYSLDTDREEQAVILDTLIKLNDQGLISLNPDNDKSSLTKEGREKFYSGFKTII